MSGVNPYLIDKYVDKYGSTITLGIVTQTFSNWGDASETTSDSTIIAVVNVMNQESDLVKAGILHAGDKVFYCKSTQQNLDRENTIIHNNLKYKINEVLDHSLKDTAYVKEVRAKKI